MKKSPRKFRPSKARNAGQPPGVERPAGDGVGMRLNKYIAHSGVCSRRQAADYIKQGLVTVNGTVVREPGYEVQTGDAITFRGAPVKLSERLVYVLLNKPRGIITTVSDDRGRQTVLDLLKGEVKERVFPVGRLDRETTGLLLLTNDGDLAKRLMHPRHRVPKVYHVTLDNPLTRADLDKIRSGLELEDGPVQVDWVNYPDEQKKRVVALQIHVGRNRVVRRLFESLGYQVEKLDRTYYAGLSKKDLPRGFFRHLTEREIIMIKHFS